MLANLQCWSASPIGVRLEIPCRTNAVTKASRTLIEERKGPVLVVTMNRPERHHALNLELSAGLAKAISRAEEDPDIRVVVVTGNGSKAFCAGQDMLEVSGDEAGSRPSSYVALDKFSSTFMPIIAAINGLCFGGGAVLAVACDIRLASESATFRLPGAEYGLVVGAAALPRLVGASKAKELILTARQFDAEEAAACGLVSSLHTADALMPAAMAMAEAIAQNSVAAVQESKRVIDAATLSEHAADLERTANERLRGSSEQTERFRNATRNVTGR